MLGRLGPSGGGGGVALNGGTHYVDKLGIGFNSSYPMPAGNLLLVSKTANEASGQMVAFEYNNTGDAGSANADVSALRVVARSMTSGNVQNRPLEVHMIKTVGAGDKPTHGIEVSCQSSVPDAAVAGQGTGFWHNGVRIMNLGDTWGVPTPQRVGNGLYVGGDEFGFENGILYQGHYFEGFPVLFRVTKTGAVSAAGAIYSTAPGSTYRVGVIDPVTAPAGDTYAGLWFDATPDRRHLRIAAVTGGAAYRPLLLTPDGGNVGVGIAPPVLAAQGGIITTTLQVGTGGTIGVQKTAGLLTPSANFSAIGPKTDEQWYRKTSAGVETQLLDAQTTKVVSQAQVQNTTDQSAVNNGLTTLAFTSESFDVGGWHDNVTNNNRLTAPATGRYRVTARASFASNVTGLRSLAIRKNGTSVAENVVSATNGSVSALLAVAVVDLAAGEYVDCAVFQNSGGALAIVGAAPATPTFDIVLQC